MLSTRTAWQGVSDCSVHRDVDLTFTRWVDHYLVAATVFLLPHPDTPQQPKKPKPPNICKWRMADPCRVQCFQDLMWHFEPSANASIAEHCKELTEYILTYAPFALGPTRDSPMQP